MVLAGCGTPPPFVPYDATVGDAPRLDVPPSDAPYVRPDAPSLPAADFEVTLPYRGDPAIIELEVEAGLAFLDVVFSVDATGSFGGEIAALQRSLESSVLPALEERVDDVAVGISRFEDFPVTPFGVDTDRPFELVTAITTSRDRIRGALAALSTRGNGGDIAESGAEALYQLGSGDGFVLDGRQLVPSFTTAASGGGRIGGAGFREGSYRVIVHVTDAPTHEPSDYGALVPGAHSSDQAIAVLSSLGARVLGIASNDVARGHLDYIALATGAVAPAAGGRCATGLRGALRPSTGGVCPLVFDIGEDGEGLSSAIVDAIANLLDTLSWREAHGEVQDDRYGFVTAIAAASAVAPAGIALPGQEDRYDGALSGMDGVLDTFTEVGTGTTLRFAVRLANTTIEAADYDQFFRVTVAITGDGLVLEERTIRITVPRRVRSDAGMLDAGQPDGGVSDPDAGGLDAVDADALDAG
jgi:hypothetical protein